MYFTFAKYHGLGNDFIVIDDRGETFPADDVKQIVQLCNRRLGVGADGLILLQKAFKADYSMRIFNCDGKETEMCGNGLRCFMAFLRDHNLALETTRIFVGGNVYTCHFEGSHIVVEMGKPTKVSWHLSLSLQGKEVVAHFIHMGVPHAVVFVEDVDKIDVEREGKEIRWHPLFQPNGVNVNFVSERGDGIFAIRTYERGVEGETLACGTGAVASAFALAKMRGVLSPLKILTTLKELIEVRLSDDEVEMIGDATFVFKGHVSLKSLQCISV